MTRWQAFAWGSIGAVLPEVLRFFKLAAAGTPLPDLNWVLYGGLLVMYVLLAGFVSIAWKPENEFKGLWVGASLPAIVATLVQTAPGIPK